MEAVREMHVYGNGAKAKKSDQEHSELGERTCRGGHSTMCRRNNARTESIAVKYPITKLSSRYARAYLALSVRVLVARTSR